MLENMRGAVAANGLATDGATVPPAAVAGDGGGGVVSFPTGDDLRDTDANSVGDTASAREKGRERQGDGAWNGVGKEERGPEGAEEGAGGMAKGSCSVRGLSWGSVGPASIKLAREQWRPQVKRPCLILLRGWAEKVALVRGWFHLFRERCYITLSVNRVA